MKPFGHLLDFDTALRRCWVLFTPNDRTERISLDNMLGRVLAEDVRATMSIPPFARAAMDGYAVVAEDTFGAGRRTPEKHTIDRSNLCR